MIIENVRHVPIQSEVICSTSACLTMFLTYYGYPVDPKGMSDLFSEVFMSTGFNSWYTHSLDMTKYEDSAMLCCAQYLIERYFPKLACAVNPTDVGKIKLSYVKRRMLVMVTGRFPLLSGRVPNTVLVKGYVGDYLIVNDPRGNANSKYVDKFGENIIYSSDNMREWTSMEGSVYLLRAIQKD